MPPRVRVFARPARRPVAVTFVAVVALLAGAVARADDPSSLRREAERLRTADAQLDARRATALLELYALESRLARSERRVAELRTRLAALASRRASARQRLRLARSTLSEVERQLATHLKALYAEGEVDPLAVLFGADSLDDAIDTLDNLSRLAAQNRRIVAQVSGARRSLRALVRILGARELELRRLTAGAEAAEASLQQARAAQSALMASLERDRRLNAGEILQLAARAAEIDASAAELTAALKAKPATPASAWASAVTGEDFGATAKPLAGGTMLRVSATGYVIHGTTVLGLPAQRGVVAVDPTLIPLGTRMTVPGYGEAVAADTGPDVRGAMIDLWFPTLEQAHAWGRRTVTIRLR